MNRKCRIDEENLLYYVKHHDIDTPEHTTHTDTHRHTHHREIVYRSLHNPARLSRHVDFPAASDRTGTESVTERGPSQGVMGIFLLLMVEAVRAGKGVVGVVVGLGHLLMGIAKWLPPCA